MTQGGKFSDPQAQRYLASQEALRVQMKAQMAAIGAEMLPAKTRLEVEAAIRTDRKGDLDNIVKAILDAAQGVAICDDRWVDWISAERWVADPGEDHAARVEIGVVLP
jgi:Holliday junction resolvase RusA-like endonuclease